MYFSMRKIFNFYAVYNELKTFNLLDVKARK